MTERDGKPFDEWLADALQDSRSQQAVCENLKVNNPQAYPNMGWIDNLYGHLEGIYMGMKLLRKDSQQTKEYVKQLLSVDQSVPPEEVAARAELLGMFVKALRDGTTAGGVGP